jgi:hypothetical protein
MDDSGIGVMVLKAKSIMEGGRGAAFHHRDQIQLKNVT